MVSKKTVLNGNWKLTVLFVFLGFLYLIFIRGLICIVLDASFDLQEKKFSFRNEGSHKQLDLSRREF